MQRNRGKKLGIEIYIIKYYDVNARKCQEIGTFFFAN